MYGCHTLVLLTFLYLTVKNYFPIYSQPLSLQLPCSNLALSLQSPIIPRRIGSLSSGVPITVPILLKLKVWYRILENVKFRLYFTLVKRVHGALQKHYLYSSCIKHEPCGSPLLAGPKKTVRCLLSVRRLQRAYMTK